MERAMVKSLMVAVLALPLVLGGCERWKMSTGYSLDFRPPPGPEIFQQAWKDGCETGIASNTNDFYKMFNTIKQNPAMMKEELYRRVWQDAYNYCWFHVSTELTQPI